MSGLDTIRFLEPSILRERGKFLGYVESPAEKAAIAEAIRQFEITNPEQHRRLIAGRGK